MPTLPVSPQLILWRQKRRQRRHRSPSRILERFAMGFLALFSLLLGLIIILGTLIYSTLVTDLPGIETLHLLLGPDGQLRHPTSFYDRSGEQQLFRLENPNAINGEYIYLELIPQTVIDATLATSDPNFWEHDGFDTSSDTTTLAVKLVSDLLLWKDPQGWRRDWRENLLAVQATRLYGRENILEWYLNSVDYGHLAYGVDEAARVYFGKPVSEVTLAEAAMLAAISEAPPLNPIDAPQIAIERQGEVLQTMLAMGYLTSDEAFSANLEPIQIQPAAPSPVNLFPDFTNLVLHQLDIHIGKSRVLRGGLEIITTLDFDLQIQAKCTTDVQISRLVGELPSDTMGGTDCQGAALLPTLHIDQLNLDTELNASVIVLDPQTGQTLALVGGPLTPQQPGTILSPFIYLTGFTRGLNPASLVWDIPASVPPSLEGYGNIDGEFHGPMRIRNALANDYLVPALATLSKVGPANVWLTAQQSGLHSLVIPSGEDVYDLILDRGRISLLEAAHAYSMLSNQGILAGHSREGENVIQPTTLLMVRDYDGHIWLNWTEPQNQSVTSPQLAYLVTDILSDEISRRETLGHPNPLETGRPSAVKIGQTLSGESAWTIGYIPQRVVAVWLGYPEDEEGSFQESRQVPPTAAGGLWHALIKTTYRNLDMQPWQEPMGINRINVCDPSGLLPTEDCPTTVTEVFMSGNEPVQVDNLYRSFLINTQTGRLATVYTPPELVEERVYLVVPQEATEWAKEAGLEIPPDTYDVIFNPSTDNETVSILSPEIFGYVSGQVSVTGNAAGDNFAYYRVQIGEGLNPRQWLQIDQDMTEPIVDGELVIWDTAGLDGLYAIRLMVVTQEQTVSTTTIQVTVDNRPPVIQVTHPAEGQSFTFPIESSLTIQAQVTDNLGIASVEFWVDDEMISRLTAPPYAAPWSGSLGEYTVRVVVIDLAGNQSETLINFIIER